MLHARHISCWWCAVWRSPPVGRASSGRTRRSQRHTAYEVSHSDADWHKMLDAAQYRVLREEGTERPVH